MTLVKALVDFLRGEVTLTNDLPNEYTRSDWTLILTMMTESFKLPSLEAVRRAL